LKEKIYLLPGLMTDERLWQRLIPRLEEYELIHIPIPNLTDFDKINDYLLDLFKGEKVNLLGFSLGGYIASYFAVKYPSLVNRLFLVGATPSSTNEKEIQRRKGKIEHIEKSGFKGLSIEKTISLLEAQNQNDKELINIVKSMFDDLGKEAFISQLSSTFNRKNLFEGLKELRIPIHFFYSKTDRLLNFNSINELLEKEHNMKVLSREGTSHMIPLEDPEGLSFKIKDWLKV